MKVGESLIIKAMPRSAYIRAGELLTKLRKEYKLSAKALSEKAGINPKAYIEYEKGRSRLPIDKISSIAKVYKMKPADLYSYLFDEEKGLEEDELPQKHIDDLKTLVGNIKNSVKNLKVAERQIKEQQKEFLKNLSDYSKIRVSQESLKKDLPNLSHRRNVKDFLLSATISTNKARIQQQDLLLVIKDFLEGLK